MLNVGTSLNSVIAWLLLRCLQVCGDNLNSFLLKSDKIAAILIKHGPSHRVRVGWGAVFCILYDQNNIPLKC